MVTKQSICSVLKSAAEVLQTGGNVYASSAQRLVNDLVQEIKIQADAAVLLPFLCHKLFDCENYANPRFVIRHFKSMAKRIKTDNPSISARLSAYTEPSNELLGLLTQVPAPSLKERVKIAGLEVDEMFLDPITGYVMDYPVTYSVGNTEYTVDLNSLLSADSGTFALKCPFSRQFIFLEDLKPRQEYIQTILQQCNQAPAPMSQQEAIKKACILAKQGNVIGLKKWRLANPYLDCTTVFNDPNNKLCTPLHMACASNQYEAILWLLEQGALIDVKNSSQRIPLEYLNLDKLKSKMKESGSSDGLVWLHALHNLYVQNNSAGYEANIIAVTNNGYTPALYWHGLYLCRKPKPHSAEQLELALDLLSKALRNNFYLSSDSIPLVMDACGSSPHMFLSSKLNSTIMDKFREYKEILVSMVSTDLALKNRASVEDLVAGFGLARHKTFSPDHFKLLHSYGVGYLSYTRKPSKKSHSMLTVIHSSLQPETSEQRSAFRNMMT